MVEQSFYWFDYETFGTHPAWDRPCQFAGVRTDKNLNIIGEPLVIYCKQTADYLPHPIACQVTGLSPQLVNRNGVAECQFIEKILEQIGKPGTCSVGYNSIRFDDEFTRHTLFRNFHDPYEYEWKDGNSRWDLLDVVRLTRALRPEGINWPTNSDGTATNRLENLTAANAIEHAQAHDALSDVYATINMARLIKKVQPKLFDYAYKHRGKQAANQMLALHERKPCLQVSGMIPARRHHISVILPLIKHPSNSNSVIVMDLHEDPSELAAMTEEQIEQRLYTPTLKTGVGTPDANGVHRPGLRTVQVNKCPVLAPLSALRPEDAKRLGMDMRRFHTHLETALPLIDEGFCNKIGRAMSRAPERGVTDVDGSLYGGGFLSADDKRRLRTLRSAPPARIQDEAAHLEDRRLIELARRYQARNYPSSMSAEQTADWKAHCRERLEDDDAPWLSFARYQQELEAMQWGADSEQLKCCLIAYMKELQDYTADFQHSPSA